MNEDQELPLDPCMFHPNMLSELAKYPELTVIKISRAQGQKLREIMANEKINRIPEPWNSIILNIIKPDSDKIFQDFHVFSHSKQDFINGAEMCKKPTGYSDFYLWLYSVVKAENKRRSLETEFVFNEKDDPLSFGWAARIVEKQNGSIFSHVNRQQAAELVQIKMIPECHKQQVEKVLNGSGEFYCKNIPAEILLLAKQHSEPNTALEQFFNWVICLFEEHEAQNNKSNEVE